MRPTIDTGYERYTGDKFEEAQERTEYQRKQLLPILGLREGQQEWFEMPVKADLEEHAGLAEVQAVRNLLIVHYVEIKDKKTPPEVLASVRGTIIYNLEGKYFVIRQSIPFTYDLVMDKIEVQDGKTVFSIPQGDKARTVKVAPTSLKIIPYIEGTVIDIMKVDGVVHWFTSHNVLARGVRREGRNIYKPAKWVEHHVPFTVSFEEIIRKTDPRLLNENDELFPKNCITSNKLYRFVLLTRERVRAEATPVPEAGFLVYIGCLTQFEYSDVRGLDLGEEHIKEYQPRTVSSIPKDTTRPFILQFSKSMTIPEANAYLAGPHPELGVLGGGGKLIVNATVVGAGERESLTFHVKSSSYVFRENMLGNTPNLYKQFLDIVSLQWYDFTDPTSLEAYYHDFPSVVLPSTQAEVLSLKEKVLEEREIIPTISQSQGVPVAPLTHAWYIFLLCVNRSARETIMRYLERYARDTEFLQQWMFSLDPTIPFKNKSDKPKDKRRAERNKDFVLSFKMEILRHELYAKGKGVPTIFLLLGDKTSKAISIARQQTNTTVESINISEPEVVFRAKKTYANITSGKAQVD